MSSLVLFECGVVLVIPVILTFGELLNGTPHPFLSAVSGSCSGGESVSWYNSISQFR
jgi:hypothetical protein